MTTTATRATVAAAVAACIAPAARAQWFLTAGTTPLPPRVQAAVAHDPYFGQTLLFGGALVAGGLGNDTWALRGSGWVQLQPTNTPTPRAGARMVHDAIRAVVVLYGGMNPSPIGGPSLDDTWEWNGFDWTAAAPLATPGGRGRFALCYDALRQRVVLYGGITNSRLLGASNQTFEYDGRTWTRNTGAAGPGPVQDAAMCYDTRFGRCLLFGGNDPLQGPVAGLWSYDGTTWTQLSPSGPVPGARSEAGLLFDPGRGAALLRGGVGLGGVILDDVWAFDGAAWTRHIDPPGPGPRRGFAWLFDTGRGRSIQSLGVSPNGVGATDLWHYGAAFDAFGAGCRGSAGVPYLFAGSGPSLGGALQTGIGNLHQSAALALLLTGFSDQFAQGLGPLPLDLSPVGMTGCRLQIDPSLWLLVGAVGGTAQASLPIPSDSALLGFEFFQQALSFEPPGWNAFGAVLSTPARCRVGH